MTTFLDTELTDDFIIIITTGNITKRSIILNTCYILTIEIGTIISYLHL